MKKSDKLFGTFIITIFLITSIVINLNPVISLKGTTIGTSWQETFDSSDSLNNWELYSYQMKDSTSFGYLEDDFTKSINSRFSIDNGTLHSPFNTYDFNHNGNMSVAWRNSTVNYGTWSFDVFLGNTQYNSQYGCNHCPAIAVDLMINHQNLGYNFTGKTYQQNFDNLTGYEIYIFYGVDADYHNEYVLLLTEWLGYSPYNLDTIYKFPSNPVDAYHNIYVTRNSTNGEINVYFDKEKIINKISSTTINSQKFGFFSLYGENNIDNITVCNTVIEPSSHPLECEGSTSSLSSSSFSSSESPFIPGFTYRPLLVVLFLFILKRRKKKFE